LTLILIMLSCSLKNNSGFSLIELMVVLAIIVALAILVLTGYSESFPRLATERAAESFIGDIHKVRGRAFSAVFYDEDAQEAGHGIRIKKGQGSYEILVEHDGKEEVLENINIDRGISVSEILLEEVVKNELKIVFTVKEKKVLFNGEEIQGGEEGEEAEITFSSESDEGLKRSVSVNSEGIAEIKYE